MHIHTLGQAVTVSAARLLKSPKAPTKAVTAWQIMALGERPPLSSESWIWPAKCLLSGMQ
jgi:hypothetical protein